MQSPRSPHPQADVHPGVEHRSVVRPAGQVTRGSWQRGRWTLLLLALLCVAPVIASYLAYYVFRPTGGTTNYGALIEPQRPIPASLVVTDQNGQSMKLASLHGRWLMIAVDGSACEKACGTKLYFMRQVRATQGPERGRIMTVWLRTDGGDVPEMIKRAYPDTTMLVADPAAVAAWLSTDPGTRVTDHIYLVDPNGNLMMRFPSNPDPSKIKTDVTKLLKWSSIG